MKKTEAIIRPHGLDSVEGFGRYSCGKEHLFFVSISSQGQSYETLSQRLRALCGSPIGDLAIQKYPID